MTPEQAFTAASTLGAADAVMGAIIARVGPYTPRERHGDPFTALLRAILAQQLSGRAAATIYGRFLALLALEDGAPPAPAAVLALPPESLRAAGLSRQKSAAVASLAAAFHDGELAGVDFASFDDEAIIARLTTVRGVGRWTAEMFLLFELGRPDVLPVNDLGINRAVMLAYGLAAMPTPAQLREIAVPWRPWASLACWYLWRSLDPPA